MHEIILVLTEKFNSEYSPDQAAIQRAVTLWLSKELNKPHK